MSETKGDAQYTMGRGKEEEDRLIQQSQLYDAVTRRMLNMAGLDRGMRVLDIGSGTGDVAMTAAERVGPEGSVVGVPAVMSYDPRTFRGDSVVSVPLMDQTFLEQAPPC